MAKHVLRFRIILSVFLILMVGQNFILAQTTYFSQTSGNPAVLGNWNSVRDGSGVAPANFTSGDIFIVQGTGGMSGAPHTMTVTAAWTILPNNTTGQVIVESGATLTLTTQNLTTPALQVDGVLNINAGRTCRVNNGSSGADFVVNATGITNINGTLILDAGTVNTVDGTINNANTFTINGALTFNAGGIYNHNQDGGTIPNETYAAGSFCNVNGVVNTVPVGMNRAFSNFTWNCPSQSVDITATMNANITGDLVITNTNGNDFILNNNINLNTNDFIVDANAIIDMQTYEVQGVANATISGILKTSNVNGFYGAANTTIENSPAITLNAGSTINYNAAGAQNVTGTATMGTNYSNLIISGSGTKTLANDVTVNNTLTISAGATLEVGNDDINILGTSSISGTFSDNNGAGNTNLANVTMQGGTLNHVDNVDISGTLTASSGTNTITGTGGITVTGATTINAGATLVNSGTGNNYYNGAVTNNGTWSSPGAIDIRFQGGLTNNGTMSTTGTGTYTFDQNNQNIAGTQPITFQGAVNISNGETVTNINTGGVTFQGALNGAGGGSTFTNTTTMYYSHNSIPMATGGLTANAAGNNVFYSFGGAQPVENTTYYNLYISGSGTKTANGAFTVSNNLNIAAGTILDDNGNQITVNGNVTNNGSATGTGGIFITGGAPPHSITGNGSYQELRVNSNTNMVAASASFSVDDLILDGGFLAINSNTLTINNSITEAGGTLTSTPAQSSITLNGSAAINLPASITGLNNFTLNNTVGSTLPGNLDVNGTLTLTQGALTTGANILSIGSSPTVGSGYITGGLTSTLRTVGANNITLPANLIQVGNTINLDIDGSGTVSSCLTTVEDIDIAVGSAFTLTCDLSVTGNIINRGTYDGRNYTTTFDRVGAGNQGINDGLNAGTYDFGAVLINTSNQVVLGRSIDVYGNWTLNGGSFTTPNREVYFRGTGAQNIGGSLSTTFYQLRTSNTALTISNDQYITNRLRFEGNGKITLGNSDLILSTSTIQNVDGNSFVVTNGTGRLLRTGAVGALTFPVAAENGGTYYYSPVTFPAGSNSVGVRAVYGQHPDNSCGSEYLNQYWNISTEAGGNLGAGNYNFTPNAGLRVGAPESAYYYGGTWTASGAVVTVPFNINLPAVGASDEIDVSGIDNATPTVLSITPSLAIITSANVGSSTFSIQVIFSESMDNASPPSISLTPAQGATLTQQGGAWSNTTYANDTYTLYYDVASSGVWVDDIDITVSDGSDACGNLQAAPYTEVDEFDIHMACLTPINAGPDQHLCEAVPGGLLANTVMAATDPSPATGIWSRVSGPGAFPLGNYGDINSSTTTLTGLAQGTHIFRWTISGGACDGDYDDVYIYNDQPTAADAGLDGESCDGTYNLLANNPVYGTGSWTIVAPAPPTVLFADNTLATTTVSDLGDGDNTLTWTITNAACSSSDAVVIVNNTVALPTAGANQTLCTNTTTMIGATVPGVDETGLWTVTQGSAVFTNATQFNTTVTSIARRDNIFRWTITKGGCSNYAEVTISNYSVTANAGLDDYTCDGTYTLAGNNPATQNITIPAIPATGTWTTPGPGNITNINLFNTYVDNLDLDDNTFRWTIDNGTCSAFDEVVISNDMPTIPDAGPDETFCGIDFAPQGYNSIYNSLTANSPDYARDGVGETGVWTQVAGTSTFLDANTTLNLRVDDLEYYAQLGGPDYWNLNPTVNTYRWTITYKLCELYDEVTITNAAPFPADAGPDQTVCWDNADLNAIDLGSGAQLHWWTEEGSVTPGLEFYDPLSGNLDNTPFNTHVEGLQIATTTFRWWKENTINALTCTIWDETDVTRVASNLGATSAGSNQIVCSREAYMQGSEPGEAFVAPPVYDVTGEWSVISGGGTFANITSNSTLVSNLNYDTNVFRWTLTNNDLGCIITNDVYITNALPSDANAGPDQNVCTNTALLSAERPTRGNGTWSVIGGGGTISNTTCVSFNCNVYVSNMSTGQNTFLWTTSNSYTDPASGATQTCELTDEIEVWNNSVTAEAGLDQTVCIDNATLAATAPGAGESGVWVRTGGSATVTNPTLYNTTVTGLSPDINTFRWTLSNAFCSDSDLITIINNNPTDPVASTPVTDICTDVAPINGNNPLNGTGVWSVSAGGGVITNPSLASTTVTGIPGGVINTYTWTITKNGCPESANVSIYNRSVTADAGTDIDDICGIEPAISTVTLAATQPNTIAGESGLWTIVSSAGTIIDVTAFNTVVNNMDNGANTFRWTISNGTCSDNDEVDVFVYIPTTAVTNPDFEACADLTDIEVLTANLPDPGRGNGTWTLVSGGGAIASNTANITNVTNLGFNENRFRWTINLNNCISTDDIIVTNNFVSSDAGPDDAICTDTYTLSGNDPTINDVVGLAQASGQWTVTQGIGVFVDATQFDTDVSGLSTAVTNILRWTVTKGGCSDWDEVSIINNEFTTSANIDQTVCNNFTTLNGQQPGGGESGVWSVQLGGGNFVDATLYNTQVNNLAVGSNIFRWTVSNATCSAFDEMEVYYNYVSANAGALDRVCSTNYLALDGNIPPGTSSGNWVALLGGATVTTPSAYNSGVTNLAVGQNTFQWTVSNTVNTVTCSAVSTVDIYNDTPTTASVEADNEVCTNFTQLSVLTIPTIGTGVWTAVDNLAMFDNSLGFNPTVTGLNRGINTFRWTVTNQGCTSTDDVIITNNRVIANAGIDKSTACADFTTLSGNNPLLTQGNGVWFDLSGSTATIVTPTLYNTSVTGLEQGVTEFRWTVSLGSCSVSDNVQITNNQITATAGVDQVTCNTFYSPLDGNDVSGVGGTGVWTSVGNTADITTPTLFNTGVTNLDPGLNTFRWTVTSGAESCTDFDEVGITNNGVISNAGSDIETCNTSINLSAVAPTIGIGTWTQASGAPVTIIDPTNRQTLITGLTGGVYSFTWTVVNAACSASDDVVVTNSSPVVSNPTTPTPETCNGNGFLQANAAGVGETGIWSGGAGATIANVSANNTTVSGMPRGVNTFIWTLTKGTNVTCTSANSVSITNNQVVANAGVDKTTVCNDFVTLSGNNPLLTQGNGLWTDQSGSTAAIVNNTLYNTLVNNVEIGTTTFRWTVSLGTCSASDDVVITNNQIVASAGSDQPTCTNSFDPLDGNDVSGVGGTGLWTTTGTGTFVDATSYNTRVENLQSGINTLTWTVTSAAEGCTDSDDVIITNNGVTADAGVDIETCNSSINLSAIAPLVGAGSWTQTGGAPVTIVTSADRQSQVTGLTSGVYSFTWTVVNGVCSASDVVNVTNSSPSVSNPTTPTPESCDGTGTIQANAAGAGETGIWSGGAGATIANVSANNTTVSGMPRGINTFIWTLTKGANVTCTSANSVNITNNQVVANAGVDKTTSCNDFVTLSGNNPLLTQGNGLWTDQSGSTATIVNNTLYNTQINNVEIGTTTFRWTVSLGTCSASDDVVVTNNQIVADAGTDQSTCSNFYDPLDGNDVSGVGGTGLWTTTGPGTFVDATSYNTRVENLQTGLNTLTWTVTSGAEGCVDSDQVIISNNSVTADAGTDREICTSSFNLSAIAPSLGTGSWTQTGGAPVTIVNSIDRQSSVTGLTGGIYAFTWTVVNGVCSTADEVIITNSSPTASNPTTPTPEVCNGNGILNANAPAAGERGEWTLTDATGTFGNATLNNTTISGLKPGTNTLTWTLYKGSSVECSSSADVSIVNNQVTANAFTSNSISCDATTTITGNNPGLQSTPGYPATGLWTVSTGATISNTTYYDNVSVTNLAQGSNVFTWTVSKGSCSTPANVTVTNDQVFATTGGNIQICGENVTLNAVNPNPNAGLWTLEGGVDIGAINIVTPSLFNSNVTGVAKTAIFKWTVTGANCSDEAFVTVNNNSIDVNDGALQTICAYTGNGSLNAGSLEVGQTGVWTSAGTNPVIANPTSEVTAVSNLDYGNNIFFWTVSNATGCSGQGRYEIVNDAPTPPNAGVDQNLCASTATLSGNTPLYGTGLWTRQGGSTFIVINDPTNSSTTVSGLGQGASTFRWTITNNACARYDEVVINNNLFDVQVGNDFAICNNSANLSVVVGAPGVWTRTSGSGVIANSTDPATAVTNLSFGENKFLWTVDDGNCVVSDEMTITVNTPEIPVTEADKTVCDYDNVSISANAPSYGTGMWVPQGGTAVVADPTNNITTVSNLINGPNTIRWILSYNGCDLFDDLVITSNAVTADAGSPQTLCADNTSLSAAPPGIGTGSWSVTSGAAIIANSLDRESAVSNLGQGANILRWTVTNVSCSKFDEVIITNDLPDQPAAGTDINTCASTVNLTGNNPAVGTGVWSTLSGTATIDDPTLYNTAVNVTPGVTTFTWTITNNACTLSDDVQVSNDSFTVNVNPDNVTCDGTFALLGTNPADVGTGTGTGEWTVINGSGTFDNSLSYATTVRNLLATGSRESIFRWTITDGLCSDADEVKITNDQVSASVTGFMTCNSTQAILANDPATQNATGLWTVDNQTTQVVDNPTYFNTSVSGLVPNAINRIRWTVSRNSCMATDTMRLEYFVPNANITIPNIVHGCADTVVLIADPNIGTGSGVWSESTGSTSIVIDNNTLATTTARNLEIGNNVFIWTVTNRGCTSTDQVSINNSLPINTAGTDRAGCTNRFAMNAQPPTPTGSGLWTLISGTVSFDDPTLFDTQVTAAPGTNIIEWTITDNGCSASKRFNVTNNLTAPNAGIDVAVCENRVQLSGSNTKIGETGLWSIDGGVTTEVFSNASINNPEVTNLRQGIITFVWTVTNGICTAEDRVVVTNNTPLVDAGPDRTLCEDFVTLNGNNPAVDGSTGEWSIGSLTVSIANPTFYATNVTNLSQGSNLFTWTIDNGICTATDDVIITSNSIDVTAGIPYTEDCADTLYLEATAPPVGYTGAWTVAEGSGVFDNTASNITVARNLTGFNKLRWTITDGLGTCSFYDEIDFLSLLPTLANTQIDKPVCSDSTTITANPPDTGLGESGLWTVVTGSPAVTIVTPTLYQTKVRNLDPGTNIFRWTISNASCNTSDIITITNNEVVADAGQDRVICDSSWTISANVTAGTGFWTSDPTTPSVVVNNSTSPNSTVDGLVYGDNNFTWTVNYNGCIDSDVVTIRSNLPRNVSAGPDQNICQNFTSLTATNPGDGSGLWTVTGGAGSFVEATANQTDVTGLSLGENRFTWTVTIGACTESSQVIVNNNSINVSAGIDQVICNQDTLVLNGTAPGAGQSGYWTAIGGTGTYFDNSNANNTIVRGIAQGTTTLTWTLQDPPSPTACSNSHSITVINNTPSPAIAGADKEVCGDNTTISAQDITIGTGLWSVKSGAGIFDDASSRNTTVRNINVGINTYTWKVTYQGCSREDDIIVNNNSVVAYIADTDIEACTPTHTVTVIGNAVGAGETGIWTKADGANTCIIASTASNITQVRELPNGQTELIWTVTNNSYGCSSSDNVIITNNYHRHNTNAYASEINPLCQDYVNVIGDPIPVDGTGAWSSTSADVTFDNPNIAATIVRALPGGTSSITWTITKDGCQSPSTFPVVNSSIYTSAGQDQVICTTITNLNAQGLLPGEWGEWDVDNGVVVITNTTDPATSVSSLIPGDNTFTWTLHNGTCDATDQVVISNNTFSVDAGVDQIACGTSFTLRGSDPLSGTGLWTVASGTGRFVDPTNFETLVEDMGNGPNTFTWTVNRNGCEASADVTIKNNLYVAVAGDDRAICSNQTTVSAQPLNASWGATGMWTAMTGGGVFNNPTIASTLVTGLSNGDNRLRWTIRKTENFVTCTSFDEMIITNNSITASAGTDETTCFDFATLSATPLSPTGTGLWLAGGFGLVTIANPTSATTSVINLQQGVNTFSWTVTDKGCTGTSTVRITSNYFLADAGLDQNITNNFTNLAASYPDPSATGSWSISSGNGTFVDVTNNATTVNNLGYGVNTFRWTVDWNSCTAYDDVNITYNALVVDAGGDDVICTDRTYLDASNFPTNATGVWTITSGGGTIVDVNNQKSEVIDITPGSVNIYRWTVTVNGYSEFDEVIITNGEFEIEAGLDNTTCGEEVRLNAEPAGINGNGVWTVVAGAGTFSNISSENAIVSNFAPGPNVFRWTVTKDTNCKNNDLLTITYNLPPTAYFETTPTEGCSPLTVEYRNATTGGSTYYWNFGESDTIVNRLDTITKTYIAYDTDSVYTTILIARSAAGCSDTMIQQVTAFGIPNIAFDAYPDVQVYPDATINIDNYSNDGYSIYEWNFGDGQSALDYQMETSFAHTYNTWGTYTITLAVNSSSSCNDTVRETIRIAPPVPMDRGGRPYSSCAPWSGTIIANVDYAAGYYWEFFDINKNPEGTSEEENPYRIFENAGTYFAYLSVVDFNGDTTDHIRIDTIVVNPNPVVDFNFQPDSVMLPNQAVHFYNQTLYGDSYEWEFGDGSPVTNEENPLHYYTEEGIYRITLRAYTEEECFGSLTKDQPVVVEPPGVCRFPNAFSPSSSEAKDGCEVNPNDVSNDIFRPVYRGVAEYKLEIFNRWGEKIFESINPYCGWNGYVNGKIAPQDVYVWKVTGKYKNGVPFKDAGDCTLLR